MKTLYTLTIAAFILSTASAFARIGETREQIDKRYGQGVHSDYQRLDGAETIKYHFNNFQVEVVFHDGKSIWEIFQRQNRLIDTSDIKMLMKANAGEGHTWHYDGVSRQWERSGSPQFIGYLWPGHEDYFCIQDVKAVEGMQNSDAGDLGGF
jgi:hypothetical protein